MPIDMIKLRWPRKFSLPRCSGSKRSTFSSMATRQFRPRWKNSRSSAKSRPPTCTGNSEPTKQKSRPSSMRKLRKLTQQAAVQVGLGVRRRQFQKLDGVGILEDVAGGVAMHFSQRW